MGAINLLIPGEQLRQGLSLFDADVPCHIGSFSELVYIETDGRDLIDDLFFYCPGNDGLFNGIF